jgi:hypothetical protein
MNDRYQRWFDLVTNTWECLRRMVSGSGKASTKGASARVWSIVGPMREDWGWEPRASACLPCARTPGRLRKGALCAVEQAEGRSLLEEGASGQRHCWACESELNVE